MDSLSARPLCYHWAPLAPVYLRWVELAADPFLIGFLIGFNPEVVTRKGRITPREDTNRKNSKLLAWYRVQNYKVGAYDNHSWDLLWEFPKYQLRCSLSMYTTQLHLSHLKGLTSPEEINTVRRSSRLNTKRHCLFWRLREKTTPCLDSVYFVDSILLATACPVLRLAKEWPLQGSWNNP